LKLKTGHNDILPKLLFKIILAYDAVWPMQSFNETKKAGIFEYVHVLGVMVYRKIKMWGAYMKNIKLSFFFLFSVFSQTNFVAETSNPCANAYDHSKPWRQVSISVP
jgi:hypothetical protein